jgi:hypothetical protein
LKQKLRQIFWRNKIEIFEEVSLGYGVADIVVCYLDYPKTISSSETFLTRSDINIYNIINNKLSITFDNIHATTRSSKQTISESIRKLVNLDYIKQEDDYFTILKKYELPFKSSFAIEGKLKDWKRALTQAQRYKWFADYSYVVMDEYYSQPAIQNLDTFIKHNIGFATINPNGDFKRIFSPKKQKPYDPVMQIMLSERIKMSLDA